VNTLQKGTTDPTGRFYGTTLNCFSFGENLSGPERIDLRFCSLHIGFGNQIPVTTKTLPIMVICMRFLSTYIKIQPGEGW
jgi:hypothetical protein